MHSLLLAVAAGTALRTVICWSFALRGLRRQRLWIDGGVGAFFRLGALRQDAREIAWFALGTNLLATLKLMEGSLPGLYLGVVLSPADAGFYLLAQRIIEKVGSFVTPTQQVAYPHLARLGDYVSFLRRDCGCGLEKLGLTLHLHRIRSFEKFTSEGMNYFYVDLFDVLEKTLPAEFGGGPGDYQLVEEEDGAGLTRLILRVRPEVGQVDEARLLNRLQAALRNGARDQQFMARLWQTTETLRIRREAPYASPRGKILPLHIPQ